MRLAFSGPSGVGKTTLCKFIKRTQGLPHLSTSAGDILSDEVKLELRTQFRYKGEGHKAVINLSSQEPVFGRVFQEEILKARELQIESDLNYVIDRCPIDNVVYFLTQAAHNSTPDFCKKFIAHAQRVYQKLDMVVRVHWSEDIPEVEDNGSRVPNIVYQRYIDGVFNDVAYRYFSQYTSPTVVNIGIWNLDARESILNRKLNGFQPELGL